MKKSRVGVALAVLLALAAYLGSPFWTVHRMRSAAQSRDGDRLAQYVDFPSVREDFKSQLASSLARRTGRQSPGNPFGALGQALAVGMANSLVDALVTRESMVRLMADAQPPSPARGPNDEGGSSKPSGSDVDTKLAYDGLDRVRVTIRRKDSSEPPVIAILSRQGLITWRLTAVRLPMAE